ncbi:MAG: hypothetical protein Q8K57_08615 [Thiobacillus sp.]|nr:hypothetical protein [Gammaproteobacteria bacterium]MDP1924829.1 hypothetical protein [Thiobacillus sp.]
MRRRIGCELAHAELFGFADFSLFALLPESIRFVGGFAQVTTLSPGTLAEVPGAS